MLRFKSGSILLLAALLAVGASAQTIDGDAATLLPDEIKTPFPAGLTAESFHVRLKEGGSWTWSGDVVFGKPDSESNQQIFLAVDELNFAPGARLITNGNIVTIFVNTLNAGNGKILAFRETDRSAQAGTPGSGAGERGRDGAVGDSGGAVSIHVVRRINGQLTVDLSGQDGGQGGDGAVGPRGARGHDGARGKSTVFDCRAGGENGGDGGRGGAGGDAGDGGKGGDAGLLYLFNVGEHPTPEASYAFTSAGGAGGAAGSPGAGGPGGDGGRRGGGDGHCKGGDRDGDQGPQGPSGARGRDGQRGTPVPAPIVRNISLELALEKAAKSHG